MKTLVALLICSLLLISFTETHAQVVEPLIVKAVDVMKHTQDRVCNPPTEDEVRQFVYWAKELGVTHIALSTPMDNPECGSAIEMTIQLVDEMRIEGIHPWFRQKPLAYQGFYNTECSFNQDEMLDVIEDYILSNPELFQDGDIFTPIPEPQNGCSTANDGRGEGSIRGVNCFSENCMFENATEFNEWLTEAVEISQEAFNRIGLSNVRVGFFGFDGFIAWGDRNPDWNGIIDLSTVLASGEITVDHYAPEDADPETEVSDIISSLEERFPNAEICIGEWGAIHGQSAEYVGEYLQALVESGITCINYWHLGPGGTEALLEIGQDGLFQPTEYFEKVKEVFASY